MSLHSLLSYYYSNMIDVGAMDTHNLEPQECQDRIQLYKQRLLQQWNNIPHQHNKPTGLKYNFYFQI